MFCISEEPMSENLAFPSALYAEIRMIYSEISAYSAAVIPYFPVSILQILRLSTVFPYDSCVSLESQGSSPVRLTIQFGVECRNQISTFKLPQLIS